MRGELSEEELVQVPADSPALWRSGVYTDWDGASWSRPAVGRRVDGPPFDIADDAGETRTDDVRVRRRASGTVWAPGPVQKVSLLGSAVGVELSLFLHRYGAEVTILEQTERLLPREDPRVGELTER